MTARAGILGRAGLAFFLGVVGAAAGCGGAERNAPVLIYAAASLSPILEEGFRGDAGVAISAASSPVLAQQIEAGAPADLFLSADPDWVDWLEDRGRVEPGSRFEFARNRLVVIGAEGTEFRFDPENPAAFPGSFRGRFAVGDPDHVPSGVVARAALRRAGNWDALSARALGAVDARAALVLVERGECEAGIVYASDASTSARVRLAGEIPEAWHDPILYEGAACAGRMRPEVERVVEVLNSPRIAALLREHGFPASEEAEWTP